MFYSFWDSSFGSLFRVPDQYITNFERLEEVYEYEYKDFQSLGEVGEIMDNIIMNLSWIIEEGEKVYKTYDPDDEI